MTGVFVFFMLAAPIPRGGTGPEPAVRLVVDASAAPLPAFKYQLLPELRELNPGNAAHNYLKCFMEQRNFFFSKEAVTDRARYQTMPLSELPVGKLREFGGAALRQADWAARMDTLDWQNLQRLQSEGMDPLPAELGPLQSLAAALQVRFRAEVAGRRYDDAIRTAKTLFALARHLGEHPAEVANLVGLWAAHLGMATLAEMIQQPGCPNLYWALTDLPCPLVDVRKAMQADRAQVAAYFGVLRNDGPASDAELEKAISRLSGILAYAREQAGRAPRSLRSLIHARATDLQLVDAGRRRLVESGLAADVVRRFPPLQVILLDEKREYEVQRDERLKMLALPFWHIDRRNGGDESTTSVDGIFSDLLPNVLKLRCGQAVLEQEIVLLRHIEAVRLYANLHKGKIIPHPADSLVPLPNDPVTGRPLSYEVRGGMAHLMASLLPGEDSGAGRRVHYEVSLRK